MLPFSPTKRYVENGYEFNETSLEWKEACRNLPCFSAVWWPDYSTAVIEETINGEPIVIQLWIGWCQKFLNRDDFPGGIMHCFGGTIEMVQELVPLGFLISWAGNVTFKNAENLREVAEIMQLNKMLVETDCPFLTPEPHRGKRNEPAYVVDTSKFLSDYIDVELPSFANQTTQNFLDFFGLTLN